jgi:hypothetical protein
MFINLEDLNLPKEEPLEMQFRQEVMNRLYDMAYRKITQYNNDLDVVDIPEFCKMPCDRLDTRIDVWLTELVTSGNLYKAYNDFILNSI